MHKINSRNTIYGVNCFGIMQYYFVCQLHLRPVQLIFRPFVGISAFDLMVSIALSLRSRDGFNVAPNVNFVLK